MRSGSQLLADAAPPRVSMPPSRIRPDASGSRRTSGLGQGGLAAAAFAHQAERLAFPDREADSRRRLSACRSAPRRIPPPGAAPARGSCEPTGRRPAIRRRGQRRRLAAALEALRAARGEDAAPRRIDEIGRGAGNPRQGNARHRRPARDRSRSRAGPGYRDGAAGRRHPPPGRSRPPCRHTSRRPGRRARPPAPGYG